MTAARRPPSVTMACVFIGLTSLIVFFSLTSALSSWGSIALQDAVRDVLKDPAFSSTSVTVAEVLRWLRWAAYGVVVVSIAGIVFAVFTARGAPAAPSSVAQARRGSRRARVADRSSRIPAAPSGCILPAPSVG